jgi:hypothetical protein
LNKRVIDREDIRLKVGQPCTHPTAAMPQGNGVVEAFKSIPPCSSFFISSHQHATDLIRHGKHHQHHHQSLRHDNDDTRPTAPPPPSPPPANSPPAREAAEIIVQEERKERSQMPTYKGLEEFKLTDKMGESVLSFLFSSHPVLMSIEVALFQMCTEE